MRETEQQNAAYEKLRRYKAGALFMEAGTGKTLAAMNLVRSVEGLPLCVWLTPCATKDNLRAEIAKQGGLHCPLIIAGIESLSSSDRIYMELRAALEAAPGAFLVVDESLKIKKSSAIRTSRVTDLGRLAEYRLILNGTPVTRDLMDLYAQVHFLSPDILRMSERQFKAAYCETVTNITRGPRGTRSKEWIVAYHNLEHLFSRIERYVYGCNLRIEVGKVQREIFCSPAAEEAERYQEIKEKYLALSKLQEMNNNIFLAMVQELQHAASLTHDKIRHLRRIIDTHQSRVLVFAKFIDTQNFLAESFPECTVLSLAKHSFGLNLQEHHVTVFFDQTWDYAQRLQAEARTYRTGQTHDCVYYTLKSGFKLDDMIASNQHRKGGLLALFKEVGNEVFESL